MRIRSTLMSALLAAAALLVASACTTGESTSTKPLPQTRVDQLDPPFSDFKAVKVRVVDPETGSEKEMCVLVADDEVLQQRGLMNVADLNGFDGMIFPYDKPQELSFWMKNVQIPLSIAFVGSDHKVIKTWDMELCTPSEVTCPSYQSNGPASLALEVPQGELEKWDLLAGSSTELTVEDTACT